MKPQNEMRSEFEKLGDIASEIENSDGELYFCETEKRYKNHRVFQDAQTGFMNGAWYSFQEQQKKIDKMTSLIRDLWTELDDRNSKEYIIEKCEPIIEELLK